MGKKVLLEFLSHKKDRHGYRNTRKQAKLINLGTKINHLGSFSTPILIYGHFNPEVYFGNTWSLYTPALQMVTVHWGVQPL